MRACRSTFSTPRWGAASATDLVEGLGLECDEIGRIATDEHQATAIPGLYAAGDVATGLNQLAVATGQAAIAATAIHNRLREKELQ